MNRHGTRRGAFVVAVPTCPITSAVRNASTCPATSPGYPTYTTANNTQLIDLGQLTELVGSAKRHPVFAGIHVACDLAEVFMNSYPVHHASWYQSTAVALHIVSTVLSS